MAKPTAIGSYIFAGGFSLGVEHHFKVLAHLEADDYGVPTFKANRPRIPVYYPIEDWPLADLHRVNFIYGNPPCAPWSSLGSGIKGMDSWQRDPRLGCVRRVFGLIEKLEPDVWAWESVTRAFLHGRPLVDQLTRQALRQGYSVTYVLHDARWLGVPQARQRFFMVAHRLAIDWQLPDFNRPQTALEALQDVKPSDRGAPNESYLIRYVSYIPDGFYGTKALQLAFDAWCRAQGKRLVRTKTGAIKGRPSFGHKRLHPDRPSLTITGYGNVHPFENRFLSISEQAVLCGYPPDYRFLGPPSGRPSLVARGVCPPVGEWLARNARVAIEERRRVKRPAVWQLDIRTPEVSYEEVDI